MQLMTAAAEVARHYEALLAAHYTWMLGGGDAARAAAEQELAPTLARRAVAGGRALDLGCGAGAHSRVLAAHGFAVTAVDACQPLLAEVPGGDAGAPIRAVRADLRPFVAEDTGRYDLVVCLGDTLTHLPDVGDVERFLADCAARLVAGGRMLVSLRDYAGIEPGSARSFLVRHEPDRMMTCTLYGEPDRVRVHDSVWTHADGAWQLAGGTYHKLRLDPAWLVRRASEHGLRVVSRREHRGLDGIELSRWSSVARG